MNGTEDERALMHRLGCRLMPVLVLMFLVAFIVAFLPSSALTARFLDDKDRQLLTAMHARASPPTAGHENPWSALWDPVVIGFGLIYILLATSYYGMTYWLPTIIRDFGVSSTVNGLLNAIPWALAALALMRCRRCFRTTDRSFASWPRSPCSAPSVSWPASC